MLLNIYFLRSGKFILLYFLKKIQKSILLCQCIFTIFANYFLIFSQSLCPKVSKNILNWQKFILVKNSCCCLNNPLQSQEDSNVQKQIFSLIIFFWVVIFDCYIKTDWLWFLLNCIWCLKRKNCNPIYFNSILFRIV